MLGWFSLASVIASARKRFSYVADRRPRPRFTILIATSRSSDWSSGHVDRAHAAAAQPCDDAVFADRLANHGICR